MEYTQNLKKERAGRPVITVTDSLQVGEVCPSIARTSDAQYARELQLLES